MTYLQKKKLAFMSIVNRVKGFVRTISGIPPLTLEKCVDEESLIDYSIKGASGGVGEKTENLFDSTQLLNANGWTALEDGVYTGTIASLWSKFNNSGQFDISIPEDATRVSVSWEGKNATQNAATFSFMFFYDDGTSSQVASQYVKTTEWENYKVQSLTGKKLVAIKSGYSKSDTIFLRNIQVTATTSYLDYEPYGKYKIPIVAKNNTSQSVVNIILDNPLAENEKINYMDNSLPMLPMFKGTTIYEVDTSIKPSNMEVTYYSSRKGE